MLFRSVEDYPPYRAMGPVLPDEYLAREERYDKQLREKQGLDPAKMSLEEKLGATRRYRMAQYESLVDAVFKRRGWTRDGCPTPEHLREIGMDLPEVLAVVEARIAGRA